MGTEKQLEVGSDRNRIFNVRQKTNVMQLNIRTFCRNQNIMHCSVILQLFCKMHNIRLLHNILLNSLTKSFKFQCCYLYICCCVLQNGKVELV